MMANVEKSVTGTHTGTTPVVRDIQTLTQRPDFLRAAQAARYGTPGFVLQGRDRRDDNPAIRIGFTCSRKVGNAVKRNRAKRRLRALARAVLPLGGCPGWDYVLVGKAGETASRRFDIMLADLERALGRVHRPRTALTKR